MFLMLKKLIIIWNQNTSMDELSNKKAVLYNTFVGDQKSRPVSIIKMYFMLCCKLPVVPRKVSISFILLHEFDYFQQNSVT